MVGSEAAWSRPGNVAEAYGELCGAARLMPCATLAGL
jgi:hypothetical protein